MVASMRCLSTRRKLALDRSVEQDDFASFATSDSAHDTLLFLSRQHHPHWTARSGEKPLETVLVNGFYLGVIVPPHTPAVEIAFEPWTRWMWIVHVLIGLGAIVLLLDRFVRKLTDRGSSSPPR